MSGPRLVAHAVGHRGLLRPQRMSRLEVMRLLLTGQLRISGGLGPVDTVERAILDHATSKATWSPPATYYLGVSTTTPTDAAGNFTEPVGNNYARVQILAAWWDAATSTAPATAVTNSAVTFGVASGSWGTLTYGGFFSAVSGGTPLWFGAIANAPTIGNGGQLSFAAGSIVLAVGDPTDTYS